MQFSPPRNRLASESSAYLLQHASNPVDWYPWGDEALALAKSLDRPILLSIGYSACHWCHVMERETFENPAIAALMNERFVCIKVDREERPDVDHLYMKALQGMTGRGGWPMTMFLTPDARPFFAGTYYPPEDRSGMPGFPRVLEGVSKTWLEKRDEVTGSAARVVAFLAADHDSQEAVFTGGALSEASESLVGSMDPDYGGFGRAPKFPGTMALTLLLEAEAVRSVEARRNLLAKTLDAMAVGGIRDHLGGGFHRYSVDRVWLVPHFEKMLYDQALLAKLYADAARHFEDPWYAGVASETLDYLLREMTSPEGGFYSAQDADSEGEEGKAFLWSREEILRHLGVARGVPFCETYGVTDEGNFEGRNILSRVDGGRGAEQTESDLAASRRLLLDVRRGRPSPATDRKILTDWNGLVISALVAVGRTVGREDLIEVAARTAAFLRSALVSDGRLRHVFASGSAKVPAFLDDYAFFGRACLDLFEAKPDAVLLDGARWCADTLLAEFRADEGGGFCFTSKRGDRLVARTCDLHDGAVPSGNSVAAELLLRLWSLTGEERYRDAGQAVLDRFLGEAMRHPYGASHLLAVAERNRRGWTMVVVVGEAGDRGRLAKAAWSNGSPGLMVLSIDSGKDWYPAALCGKTPPPHGAVAYVCEGSTCSLPIRDEQELRARLRGGGKGKED